jgi:hypothetical protein
MELSTRENTKSRMFRLVWLLSGVFGLFALTFPIAMFRASELEKLGGSHVRSLTIEGQSPPVTTRR